MFHTSLTTAKRRFVGSAGIPLPGKDGSMRRTGLLVVIGVLLMLSSRAGARELALTPATATPIFSGSPYIGGDGVTLLQVGQPGVVTVVAVSKYDEQEIAVVVHNNTDRQLEEVNVIARAESPEGKLFAVGRSDGGGLSPFHVFPGDYAFGSIRFRGVDLPSNVTFDFEADGFSPGKGNYSGRDFVVLSAELIADRVVGEVRNEHDEVPGAASVSVACLDFSGTPLSVREENIGHLPIRQGTVIPFQVHVKDEPSCDRVLVAARGYNWTAPQIANHGESELLLAGR